MFNKFKFKYNIFFLFCLFPFLSIIQIKTDSQPNALLFGLILFIINYNKFKLPKYYLIIFFIFLIASILYLFSEHNFENTLNYTIYFSLLIIPFVTYISLTRANGLSFKLFKYSVHFWFFVGLIQLYLYPEFLTFLIMRSSGATLYGRGVGSLAPEPTYYGTICAFFLVIYIINFTNKKDFKLLLSIFIQIFLFSRSSTIIFIIIISIILYFLLVLFISNIKYLFYFVFILFLSFIQFFIFIDFWDQTRFFQIVKILLKNPILVLNDESISERINHTFFPIKSLFDNNGFPHLFGSFKSYININILSNNYPILLNDSINTDHYKKIMNAYGTVIFDLGFISILIPFLFILLFKPLFSNKYMILAYILFNLLLLTAISFNNAIILFIIGNLFYINKKKIMF